MTRITQVSAQDAKSLIERKDALMVDVRRVEDYESSCIEGAVLADKNKVHETIDPGEKSRTIICYCYRGISSRIACKNLTKAGFTHVLNLQGGYEAWKEFCL